MNLEWIAEDEKNTLGHTTKMTLDNKTILSPHHAITYKDYEIVKKVDRLTELKDSNLVVAGEILSHQAFNGVGTNSIITDALFKRMQNRTLKGKANLIHTRIPEDYTIGDITKPIDRVSELQTSALVGIQIDAQASAIIPPLNAGISSFGAFKSVYERTKIEIQTSKAKDIVGYIPTTKELGLVWKVVEAYLKDDIRFFAVDFSGSPMNRALIRTVASAIRNNLKIKSKVKESKDKQYYLHVFDVSSNRKSSLPISPITDVLTHSYGVDSTSGVVWGGGKLDRTKLRYFNMKDYGAYHIGKITNSIMSNDTLISGSTPEVYEKLRADKLIEYRKECATISDVISGDLLDYSSYLSTKTIAQNDVKNALLDIKEIKANS
jgi:hypothetical protein